MDESNVNVLVKLFDTLKESINKDEVATQKLIMQQLELVNQIKALPVEELKQMLKEHAKESMNDIDECSGTVELKTGEILDLVGDLKNKITKMMIVISVIIAVSTSGYFLIRYAAEKNIGQTNWEERLNQIENKQQEDFKKRLDQLTDDLRKEMQLLHQNDIISGEEHDESIHN